MSRLSIYNKTSIIRIFWLCELASLVPSAMNIYIPIFDYLDSWLIIQTIKPRVPIIKVRLYNTCFGSSFCESINITLLCIFLWLLQNHEEQGDTLIAIQASLSICKLCIYLCFSSFCKSLQHSSIEILLKEPTKSDLWYWTIFKESKGGAGVSYFILKAHVVKTIIICTIQH